MKIASITAVFSSWFSKASDIPDSIRITIPMVITLALFYSLDLTAAGIGGLITGWILGAQMRGLPYLKRLQILIISTIIVAVATQLAFLVYDNKWYSSLTLCSIAVIYGLMSNQRPHLKLFGYNFGFTYIMALHFAAVGNPLWSILSANMFASVCVMISSLFLWPFFRGKIVDQHCINTNNALADWFNALRLSLPEQELEAKRHYFYECAHRVAYFSNSISSSKCREQVKIELQRQLELAEYVISLERLINYEVKETIRPQLFNWIEIAAEQIKNKRQITADFQADDTDTLDYTVEIIKQIKHCYNITNLKEFDYSKNIYLFTSDTASFFHDFRAALTFNSKEWLHGIKIAMTLAITQFLTYFYHLPQGYWISLTAFIVLLTSSIGVTNRRIWHRFYGTSLGGIYCFLSFYFIPHQYLLTLTCISVFFAFTSYHKERYDIHVFWLTSMIVFSVGLLAPDNMYVTFYRMIDTLFGVTIAFSVNYFIAPSWSMKWLDRHTSSTVNSQILYIAALKRPLLEQKLKLYQAQDYYNALKGEITNLLKEPNLSHRTTKDWLSLLTLLRRLNDSLLLATKLGIHSTQHHELTQRWINELQWVETTFPNRCNYDNQPPTELAIKQPKDMLCTMIEQDIERLKAWMLYQRPFSV